MNSFFCFFFIFFFFKQKTAYEILTCDWSSDVCSSDLIALNVFDKNIILFFPAQIAKLIGNSHVIMVFSIASSFVFAQSYKSV